MLSVDDFAVKETEGVCSKGKTEITRDYMIGEFQSFLNVYDKRPESENHQGKHNDAKI